MGDNIEASETIPSAPPPPYSSIVPVVNHGSPGVITNEREMKNFASPDFLPSTAVPEVNQGNEIENKRKKDCCERCCGDCCEGCCYSGNTRSNDTCFWICCFASHHHHHDHGNDHDSCCDCDCCGGDGGCCDCCGDGDCCDCDCGDCDCDCGDCDCGDCDCGDCDC